MFQGALKLKVERKNRHVRILLQSLRFKPAYKVYGSLICLSINDKRGIASSLSIIINEVPRLAIS